MKAIRMNKKDDPDDVSLTDGHCIFLEDSKYLTYISMVKDSPEVRNVYVMGFYRLSLMFLVEQKSNCTRLKAVEMQNRTKFKNAVVTGIVGANDTRHFLYISTVDLQKGERRVLTFFGASFELTEALRFANSDYALACALEDVKRLPWIVISYDIECNHCVNRVKRFAEHFPELLDVVQRIKGCIPKAHLRNHKDDCQYRYSFNYTDGVGRTCGEGIEIGWVEENQTSGSTKEMNAGRRHDTLDDFNNYYNWEKVIKCRSSISLIQFTFGSKAQFQLVFCFAFTPTIYLC